MADDPKATAREEELLIAELEELGRTGGGIGGLLGGGLGGLFGGRRGGARGAAQAAGKIQTDREQLELELTGSPREVLDSASAMLAAEGKLIDDPPDEDVWAVVGAGSGGLNPVIVRVAAESTSDGDTLARIRTVAKEGMIKQHAARKTADKVGEALRRIAS